MRAIGSDLHMDYTAVGQTTHLAARMEQMATPGSILITADVLRLAEGYVQVTRAGTGAGQGTDRARRRCTSWLGAGPVRSRLQAAAARGLTRFVGRDRELDDLAPGPGAGRERPWPSRGAGRRARGGQVPPRLRVHPLPPHPGLAACWRAARCPTARPRPTSRSWTCSSATCHIEDRDEPRTVRAKVTGQLLTLDEALQETIPALLALLDALPADSPFLALDPPAAPATHPGRAQARAAARKPGAAPAPGLRGPALDRRRDPGRCSTAWSRACRRPACCCWSTTARSTSTAGAVRPTTRNCGSTRCPRPAPTSSCRPCWGTTPAWRRSSRS